MNTGNGRKSGHFLFLHDMDKNIIDYPLGVLSFVLATWLGRVTVSDLQAVSTIFAQLAIALATAYRLYSDVKNKKKKP